MKIIRTKLLPSGFKAVTLGPIIFAKPNTLLSEVDINHESIHWEQERETLIFPFILWYMIEWLIKLFTTKDAYKNISFEKEAYNNEDNLDYLNTRKHYNWLKLL